MSGSDSILYPRAAMDQWLGSGVSKSSYTLEEFRELIEPTYQVYEDYIRKCVAGLTILAAQRAALHQEDDIPKLGNIVLEMVPFWGLDGGAYADKESVRQMERQYRDAFDQAVSTAQQSGEAPSLPDSTRKEVLIALEIHRQELENDGELGDWIDECVSLQEQLRSEWRLDVDVSQQTVPEMGGMSL